MTTQAGWRYAVQVLREDDSCVAQVPVALDLDPAREWLRFAALSQGQPAALALALDCTVEPIWDRTRGEPHAGGLRLRADGETVPGLSVEFGVSMFTAAARDVATGLVKDGVLQEGDKIRCLALAFASLEGEQGKATPRFKTRSTTPVLSISDGILDDYLTRSSPHTVGKDADADMPVFIPRHVLDETRHLAHEAVATETGGLLIGYLRRDSVRGGLFAEVTAQLPARHVEAESARLTFTSETWTDFRETLELRRRGEMMLGWWHSHPVREWCKSCTEEKQRACSLRGDFLSEDDRLLHRTVFPRAWSLALVVNDVGDEDPTLSLFGWRNALLEIRGFHELGTESVAASTGREANEEFTHA